MKVTDEMLQEHAEEARNLFLSTLPQREELPKYKTSLKFQWRMKHLLHQTNRSGWHDLKHYASRAAVFALLSVSLSCSALTMTSQAFRQQIISTVMNVYREYTEFQLEYSPEYPVEENVGNFELTYLPEGMKEVKREVFSASCVFHFENADGAVLDITQDVHNEDMVGTLSVDTEDAEVQQFSLGTSLAMAVSKKGNQTILWSVENSTFLIYSTLPLEEVQAVAYGLTLIP